MKLNTEIGKIYDTIFYLSFHFYEEMNISHCFRNSDNIEEDLKNLYIIKSKHLDISELISLFFYKDYNYHNFMSDFIFDNLNFEKDDFNCLLNKVKDKTFFKKYFINKYFNNTTYQDKKSIFKNVNSLLTYKIIESMNMPESFKFQLKRTLDLFEELIDELIRTLIAVYKEVELLHELNKHSITNFTKDCNNKTDKLSTYFNMEPHLTASSIISISLLCNYMNSFNKFSVPFLILGQKIFELMDKSYMHISWNSISKIMIDPAKVKIIELFFSQNEYSCPQIVRMLHYAKSTVAHHLDMLLQEKIIIYSKTLNRTFYYKINPEYFDKLYEFVNETRLKAHGLKLPNDEIRRLIKYEKTKKTLEETNYSNLIS